MPEPPECIVIDKHNVDKDDDADNGEELVMEANEYKDDVAHESVKQNRDYLAA